MSAGPTTVTMSQAEYAAHRGVSRQAISKLVKRGVIPTDEKGRIDPQVADLKCQTHLDPARSKTVAASSAGGMQPRLPLVLTPAPAPPIGGDEAASEPVEPPRALPPDIDTNAGARAIREKADALRAKLDYEKALGAVVDRAGVERAAADIATALRDTLMGLPVRIGPGLVGIDDAGEIVRRLEAEFRVVLQGAAKSMRASLERISV